MVAQKEGFAPGVISRLKIGEKQEDRVDIGVITLRKVTGDFEIVGRLYPLGVSPPIESNRYTATPDVKLNLYGFNAVEMRVGEAGDDGNCNYEGWEEFNASKEFTLSGGDGLKTVCVQFRDENGKTTPDLKSSIILDTTPPEIYQFSPMSSSVVREYGGEYYFRGRGNFPMEFSVVDNTTGAYQVKVTVDGVEGNWDSYQPYISFPLNGEGEHVIWGCFRDYAHNKACVGAPVKVIKDSYSPVVSSFTVDVVNGVTNSLDVHYHVEGYDPNNGVNDLLMLVSDRSDFAGVQWQAYSDEGWYSFSSDGYKTLYLKLKDKAGNESETKEVSLTIDTKPPENISFQIYGNNVTNTTSPLFYISADDATSYRISEDVRFSSDPWKDYHNGGYVHFTISSTPGWHTVYCQFKDAAGNISETLSQQVYLDAQPPVAGSISVEGADNGYVNDRNVTLSISASGADYMELWGDKGSYEGVYKPVVPVQLTGGDGVKKIYVKFYDRAGNYSNTISTDVILDITPPVAGSLKIVGESLGDDELTRSRYVTLEISATGADYMRVNNGEWEAYSVTRSFYLTGDDGVKSVCADFKDKAGNESSSSVCDTITLDSTPPVIDSLVLNYGKSTTSTHTVHISLSVSGDPYQMKVAENLGSAGWVPYHSITDVTVSQGDGIKVINVVVRDGAGNESEIYSGSVVVDTGAPANPEVVINNGAGYTDSVLVHLSLFAQGASRMCFSNDNVTYSNCEAYSSGKEWTLDGSSDGAKNVWVKFVDDGGNTTIVSNSIVLDRGRPTGSVVINNNDSYTTDRNVLLTLSASDSTSGVEEVRISEDSRFSGVTFETYRELKNVVLSEGEGEKTIYVQYRDRAGNLSEIYSDSIVFDKTAPANISFTIDPSPYTSSRNVVLNISATDSNSWAGNDVSFKLSYRSDFSGAEWESCGSTSCNITKSYTLGVTEGTQTLYIKFKDSAGNESGVVNASTFLDMSPPTGASLTISSKNQYGYINHSTNVNLVLMASDAYEMKITGDVTGENIWRTYTPSYAVNLAGSDGLKLYAQLLKMKLIMWQARYVIM